MLEINKIHPMDAIEGLKRLADESVDLVVTDPPYNIASKNKTTVQKGKLMSTQEAWGDWDMFHPFDFDVLIMQLISQCYRVLKPGGALYMFTAREQNAYYIRKAVARGFNYRNVIAMTKLTPLPSFYKNHWRSGFDLCMYLTKGKGKSKTFNFLEQSEMVTVFGYRSSFKLTAHPTEKPLEIIERMVRVSSNPGDLVLDPFMGSGTTAAACKKWGRHYLGFEINKDYLKMAKDRLDKTKSLSTSQDRSTSSGTLKNSVKRQTTGGHLA